MKNFKNKKQPVIAQRNNSKQLPPPLREVTQKGGGSTLNKSESCPPPLRGRKEFLCERSELRNSGGGYNPSTRKAAFTLAEVLITLAVIGIVAVLTIPALVKNHQERTWSTARDVFTKKFEVALKTMANDSTVSGYDSTESFVNELKKYIKITNVCTDDVTKCFAPKVVWTSNEEAVDVTNNAVKYNENGDWAETVGIQFANGVNALISYNKQCYVDPYNNQEAVTSKCVGIIYDVSGFKTPNTNGKDIFAANVAELSGKLPCIFTIPDGNRCVTQVLLPGTDYSPMTYAECDAQKGDLGISECGVDNDYWAGAVAACGGINNMPTVADLSKIVSLLYEGKPTIRDTEDKDGLTYNGNASKLSLPEPPFDVWSSKETNSSDAHHRYFNSKRSFWGNGGRRNASFYTALCLGD